MWNCKRRKRELPPGVRVQTGAVDAKKRSLGPSSDSSGSEDLTAGRIISIHMENFMCHSNLEITFDKRVTFVTGVNGSGKSAIMTALVVALGGSAYTTGRGRELADFIKQGATWARVTVRLNNEGLNSYKREIYGNEIVIVRSLSKNASGSYVCKSESGEVISKKKQEVDRIVTLLDLQIRNPICVLNQDVARSFLCTSDSAMRYQLFLKATHLEDIKNIYLETNNQLQNSKNDLENKIIAIGQASKEIDYLKEKLSYLDTLENMMKERESLQAEYNWALVTEDENSLQDLRNQERQISDLKREDHEKHRIILEGMDRYMEQITDLKEKISAAENDLCASRNRRRDSEIEIQTLQRQIDNQNKRLSQLVSKSDRQKSEINSLKEHLQKGGDSTNMNQSRRNEIVGRLKKLEHSLAATRNRLEIYQRDLDNGMETKLQHSMGLENLKADVNDLERSKRILEVQAERTADNELLKYGPFIPKLQELIDEAYEKKQFRKKPVGICGLYVTLSGDKKWGRAVEAVIGGLMNTYCCDNQKDFQILNRIMDKVCDGKNPSVIISKFQDSRYNVSEKKVSVKGYDTLLDVLHFSNDVVFNMFIDQARIETVLLFETDAQAASLLTHVQNVPKNLRMGLTLDGDQYFPAPNYRTYQGDTYRSLKYFGTPKKCQLIRDRLEEEIQKKELAIKEKKLELSDVRREMIKVIDFLKKTDSNVDLMRLDERKFESEMKLLKNELESYPVELTRLALEEELKDLEKNNAELQEKIDQEKEIVEALLRNKEKLVQEVDEVLNMENDLLEEISALEKELEDAKGELHRQRTAKAAVEFKIENARIELSDIRSQIKDKEDSLALRHVQAYEEHPERIETLRCSEDILKLLNKCRNYIDAAGRNVSQKTDILNEYNLKLKKFENIKTSAAHMQNTVRTLQEQVCVKRHTYQRLLSETASLVTYNFQSSLSMRSYSGDLRFDFVGETLDFAFRGRDGSIRTDTKTLSGGERSYSMVSFILAIWRYIRMPFYFLDEFDVFMDKVNRKGIIDLLLQYAHLDKKTQFIFITPQDISSIRASNYVSIYRMPNPRK